MLNNNHNDLYQLSFTFLQRKIEAKKRGLNVNEIIGQYLKEDKPPSKMRLNQAYEQFIFSAANTCNQNIILSAIGGSFENLSTILYAFNPKKAWEIYGENPAALLDAIKKINPTGSLERAPKSVMYKYCKTITEISKFFSRFKDGNDFFSYCCKYYDDMVTRPALPLIISAQIYGIQLALASDALKELGFSGYCKPDSQIRKVLIGIGACSDRATDFYIQQVLTEIALTNDESPFNLDKILWLIFARNTFYKHPELNKLMHKTLIEEFINYITDARATHQITNVEDVKGVLCLI